MGVLTDRALHFGKMVSQRALFGDSVISQAVWSPGLYSVLCSDSSSDQSKCVKESVY